MSKPAKKPILCLDFDGVCHSYVSGWQGMDNIPDPPIDGLFPFILEAAKHFDVQVFSSRSRWPEGLSAMKVWFGKHYWEWLNSLGDKDLDYWYGKITDITTLLTFPDHKPPAAVTLDDRAITFVGAWPSMERLVNFQSWTKGQDNLQGYEELQKQLKQYKCKICGFSYSKADIVESSMEGEPGYVCKSCEWMWKQCTPVEPEGI